MTGSIIIITFFILGIISGLLNIIPGGWISSNLSYYALCTLMFFVGMTIGSDRKILGSLRQLNPKLILLPVLTIMGTLAGCMAVSMILHHRDWSDCLAIGSGMGYYSLSSIFITQMRGAELGTIALLANIIREVITLLFAPWIAKYFGPLASISVGGATSMDTTLPIITHATGPQYSVISIFHGFLCDFSVPFLVTFFCSF